jgi:hypothetical protein
MINKGTPYLVYTYREWLDRLDVVEREVKKVEEDLDYFISVAGLTRAEEQWTILEGLRSGLERDQEANGWKGEDRLVYLDT